MAQYGDLGARLSLVVWFNLLRFLTDSPMTVNDLTRVAIFPLRGYAPTPACLFAQTEVATRGRRLKSDHPGDGGPYLLHGRSVHPNRTETCGWSISPSGNYSLELLSFLSISRMDASLMNARALRVRFSKSLASRRHRLSQANVRSTTQRPGATSPCSTCAIRDLLQKRPPASLHPGDPGH